MEWLHGRTIESRSLNSSSHLRNAGDTLGLHEAASTHLHDRRYFSRSLLIMKKDALVLQRTGLKDLGAVDCK